MKSQAELYDRISFIAAVLLVLLWGYAAFSKLAEYDRFVEQMLLAPVPLMKFFGPLLGWIIPAVELVLLGLLLWDRFRRMGLLFSLLLLLVFQGYILVMLLSGLDLPCTCGGLISKLQWKEHLIFNAVFMGVALGPLLFRWYFRKDFSAEYSLREKRGGRYIINQFFKP